MPFGSTPKRIAGSARSPVMAGTGAAAAAGWAAWTAPAGIARPDTSAHEASRTKRFIENPPTAAPAASPALLDHPLEFANLFPRSAIPVHPARVPARLRTEACREELHQRPYPRRRRPARHHRVKGALLRRIIGEKRNELALLETRRGDEAWQDADAEAGDGGGAQHLAIVGPQPRLAPHIFPALADPESPDLVRVEEDVVAREVARMLRASAAFEIEGARHRHLAHRRDSAGDEGAVLQRTDPDGKVV